MCSSDLKQNRTIPPLRHELVHQLKRDRPGLTIELNGGLQDLESCHQQLQLVDGVMVGRAAYDHPLRWAPVDPLLFGDDSQPLASASTVVAGWPVGSPSFRVSTSTEPSSTDSSELPSSCTSIT